MAGFKEALAKVLKAEGGYVNNKNDKGGRTFKGITQKVYEAYIGRKLSEAEAETVMRNMPQAHIEAIYKKGYWDTISGDKITKFTVATAMFDQSVNRGYTAAIKMAQEAVGVTADGLMGPKTLAAINATNESTFQSKYLAIAKTKYEAIAKNDPSQAEFLKGWLNRVENLRTYVVANLGKINSTQVGIGLGAIVMISVAGYFAYQMFAKPATLAKQQTLVSKAV